MTTLDRDSNIPEGRAGTSPRTEFDAGAVTSQRSAGAGSRPRDPTVGVHPVIPRSLTRRLRQAEVVSFDVFDTAILRALVQPADLFVLMEGEARRVSNAALSDFAAARPHAEALARQRAWQIRRSREVTLDEIYAVLRDVTGVDPDIAQRLLALEIEAEYAICRQNPFIHAIYQRCIETGKQIAFVSDMYLPEAVIAQILRRSGYDAYRALLVSSASGNTKADGTLHDEARSLLATRHWLHIGDNYHADIVMARKRGMTTWYYRRCVAEFKRGYPSPLPWQNGHPESGSVAHGLVANRLSRARPAPRYRKDAASFWHDFGYTTAGPLFVGFTEWLIERAAAHGLEALYFLARDGLIMRRVYEALAPLSGGGLETHYLWASRRALNIAAITEIDEQSLDFLIGASRTLEAKDYVERLGLDWRDYTDAFRAAGFASPRQRVTDQDGEACLRRLIKALAEPVCERASEERSILTDYLRHSGMRGGRRVGVVDIGWRGSLQQSIADILDINGGGPRITGLYLGTGLFLGLLKQHTPLFNPKYPHDAYLFRLGQPVEYADLIRTSVAVVELLFSAAEGSIIRIERDRGGDFIAIRDSDGADVDRDEAIGRLQDGALDFVHDYIVLKRQFPDLTVPRHAAVAQLKRVLLHPNRAEAELIGNIRHDDAFGEVIRRPIARPPNWLRLLAGRRAFRRALRATYWEPGRDARVARLGRAVYRFVTR